MPACAAYACSNRPSRKTPGITFHKFPAEPKLRRAWVCAVKRQNWKPTANSQLCSKHFAEDQIDRTSLSIVRLRKDAIPTIFDFPPYIRKVLAEKEKIESTYQNQKESFFDEDEESGDEEVEDKDSVDEESENEEEMMGDIGELAKQVEITQNLIADQCNESFDNSVRQITPNAAHNNIQYVPHAALLNELSKSIVVKKTFETHDASTSPMRKSEDKETMKRKLESSDLLLDSYRKKIKNLQQKSRRHRQRLVNLKHDIFEELHKRQYLSSNCNFKAGEKVCLLDRESIRLCLSSDSEELD